MSVKDVCYMVHTSIYLALLLVTQDADPLGNIHLQLTGSNIYSALISPSKIYSTAWQPLVTPGLLLTLIKKLKGQSCTHHIFLSHMWQETSSWTVG